ncbi:MAG: hypothetical protein DRO11_03995, partial [Methanobacteriota archaeon]
EEVKQLRLGQEKLWEEVKQLRLGQEKLWEEVKQLRLGQEKLWEEVKGLRLNFRQLGKTVGMTLEHYTAAALEEILTERGYPEEKLGVQVGVKIKHGEKLLELDLFNEDPFLVGEVTTYIGSPGEAEREVEKLLERARLLEEIFERRVEIKVMAVVNLERKVSEVLRKLSDKHGILLIAGGDKRGEMLVFSEETL